MFKQFLIDLLSRSRALSRHCHLRIVVVCLLSNGYGVAVVKATQSPRLSEGVSMKSFRWNAVRSK